MNSGAATNFTISVEGKAIAFPCERGETVPVYASTYQLTAWLRFQSLDARQIDKLSRPSHFTQRPEQATDADRAFVVAEFPLPAEFTAGFNPPEVVARFPLIVRGQSVCEYQLYLYTKTAVASSDVTVRQ